MKEQLSLTRLVLLHLLPGALAMILMLAAGPVLEGYGILPTVPILFIFIAPVLCVIQLGFLYHKGRRLNGKYSLKGLCSIETNPPKV